MKNFIEICKYSQAELKKYLVNFLRSKGRVVQIDDGYIYSAPKDKKTEIPVLLVAHMDTVHTKKISEVEKVPCCTKGLTKIETRISSPQGIGGDDRCGIWAIMNLVDEYNCHILFTEDEETGGQGARKFSKTPLCQMVAKDIKYMVEIDRKGNNDAVFYSCDNKDFTEWITTNTKFKEAQGSFTDISILMPAMKIAGVNLSSGYYNAHTLNEYVVEEELEEIIDRIGDLLSLQIPKTFEYVEKKYVPRSYNYYADDDWYGNYYGNHSFQTSCFKNTSSGINTTTKKKHKSFDEYSEIRLTVCSSEACMYYGIDEIEIVGMTKAECLSKLFIDYPDLSFSMIDDIFWE